MSPEFKCGDLILKLDLGEPSEKAQKKAFEELRETPENITNGLKELKKLLKAETDLNIPRDNDEWLMKFLRVCKYYPESARDLVRRYYTIRGKYPEITNLLIPLKLNHVFNANLAAIMPQRDQHGRRIVITLGGKQWDYKTIHRNDLYASNTICTDLLLLEPETHINGIVYIIDLQALSIGQALEYTPYSVKRVLDYIQGNIPLRMKGVHIVNQPRLFHPIFAAAKPFFSSKFANRIFMHGSNYSSLHKYISPDLLPACYGGTLKAELMYSHETYELLSYYEKYFENLHSYGLIKK